MKRLNRIVIILLLIAAAGGGVYAYIVAGQLTKPALHAVAPPNIKLSYEDVALTAQDGRKIAGWLFRGKETAPAIVLLHAIRGNRNDMIPRVQFLHRLGYNVLALDLPAHGQSGGDHITFGARESAAAAAALQFFQHTFPDSKTAALGKSLGGAAILLGSAPATFDAIILESVYSDIDRAIANRLEIRLGWLGRMLSPVFTVQLEPRLGVKKEQLNPAKAIRHYQGAVFIVSGDQDRHTKPRNTRLLFDAAKDPKTLWLVKGAGHVDLHKFAGRRYEHNVKTFLRLHLGQ